MDIADIFLHSSTVVLVEINFIFLDNVNLTKPLNLPVTFCAIFFKDFDSLSKWEALNMTEQGLTSHQTHHRSYQGRYLQVI